MFCFVLHYVCFLIFYMVLWAAISICTLLFSSHYVYVLDIHTSLCYYALLIACSDNHLLCYIMIVVIFIWLFVFDQVAHMFHILFTWLHFTCYIILILFEGLMCFVQVFQEIGIYVPSSSQVLDLGLGEFFHCSLTFKSNVCYRVWKLT